MAVQWFRKSSQDYGKPFLESLREYLDSVSAAQRKAILGPFGAAYSPPTGEGLTIEQKEQLGLLSKNKKQVKCQCYSKGEYCKLHKIQFIPLWREE